MSKRLKFSIVTPSFNQGQYIRDCINSVLEQREVSLEHIVFDACSQDNTKEILSKFGHLKWFSEPDSGPANAINKSFRKAEGDIFGWINADDYYESNVLGIVESEFMKGADLVYGNLTFVDKYKNVIYEDKTVEYEKANLLNFAPDVRQPCTFFSRELFEKVGGLNEKFKYIFDFEMFVRMLDTARLSYIDANLAYYRDYDETLTRSNIRKQAVELFIAGRMHGSKLISVYNKKIIGKLVRGKL